MANANMIIMWNAGTLSFVMCMCMGVLQKPSPCGVEHKNIMMCLYRYGISIESWSPDIAS